MSPDQGSDALEVGLCASCRHVRIIRNRRGSSFYLCERAREDPGYRRYPRLPVLDCPGWDATARVRDAPDVESK